jgi:6-pyruvoyltetrahydropterin/6-carboxytetrahydropterin synthase
LVVEAHAKLVEAASSIVDLRCLMLGARPSLTSYNAAMVFEISTTHQFSAAHQLKLYDGSLEPLHGHNWVVRVTVRRETLDSIGVVMDFHALERFIDEVVRPMHNRNLNDVPPFGGGDGGGELNPTTENVALHVGRSVQPKLPDGVALLSVEVWETATCRAVYRP